MSFKEPILTTMSGGPGKTVVPELLETVDVSLSVFDGGSVKDAGNAGKASVEVLKAWTLRSGNVGGVWWKESKLGESDGKVVTTVLCELSSSIGSAFPETGLLELVSSG